jgi:lipoate-protein ligase A
VPVFQSLDIYNDHVPRSAALNMAVDEALWENAIAPSLRFYQWDHPALSFGYFGRYQDVTDYAGERDLVRRCTGGGIVLHGDDLTYALIIPSSQFPASPLTVYTMVHRAIQDALIESGLVATLVQTDSSFNRDRRNSSNGAGRVSGNGRPLVAGPVSPNDSYACFANPVASDVLVNGVKVAGAAQRRSRRGLLQQGSIQKVSLAEGFRYRLARLLCANHVVRELDAILLEKARHLAANKYQMENWLRRR